METLQPDSPTQLQTESYNQFCRSILEVCGARVHRLWAKQGFTFSAQNDDWDHSWTARTGIPLARFEERWNRLSKVTYSPEPGESHPFCDPDPRNLAFDSSTAGPSLFSWIRIYRIHDWFLLQFSNTSWQILRITLSVKKD